MYNFYFRSTPGKRLIDADTGRVVGTFDGEGFLSADEVASSCAASLIGRVKAAYPAYFAVNFTVWDAHAEPIVGAEIQIGGQSYHTDETGSVSLKLLSGTYPVCVSGDGYDEEKDEITVGCVPLNVTYSLSLTRG